MLGMLWYLLCFIFWCHLLLLNIYFGVTGFLLSNAESWDTPVNQRSTRDTRKEPGTNAAIVASNCVG